MSQEFDNFAVIMARKKQDIILENVVIEAVAAEGKALARIDGTVLFVQFAVPGDVVDVKVTKKKKNYMEGFILRMVKPSEHRLEPFCKHFGVCGGCKWQPLPYEMQLQAKQQQVYDQLVRIGHLDVPEISPIVPSDKTTYYRNKLEFTFSQRRWIFDNEDPEGMTDQEKYGLGFHVGRFFDKVLDIEHCYLQPEPSNAIRLFIKKYALEHGLTFFNIRDHVGFLRNMFIRTTEEGNVMLIICFFHEDAEARTALLDAVAAEFPQITSLYYVINGKANDSISDPDLRLGVDFERRKDLKVSLRTVIKSSWICENMTVVTDQPVGEFLMEVNIDPKHMNDSCFTYCRTNPADACKEGLIRCTGESFMIPRS